MPFATQRAGLTGAAATGSAVVLLALAASGAPAQDTCTYDPTQCSNYTGQPSGTSPGGSGTKPASAVSGRASIAPTRRCTKSSFPVTVSGRAMQRVTVYVNGRLAKRVNVKSTATRVTTRLPTPVATSKLKIKVSFTSASGTRPKTFERTVRRCVPAAVKPNFTG